MTQWKRVLALIAVLALADCGGDSPSQGVTPTPTPHPKAVINVLIDPNPIVAVPSGDPDYPWAFAVNLQLSDSGGVGFIVVSMQITITAASTGLTWSSSDNLFVGVKVPPNGQATKQFRQPQWRMDREKTKEGTFNVKMNFLDDAGNTSAYDSTVSVRRVDDPVHLP